MKNNKIVLIAFLLGATAYSIFMYASSLKEKNILLMTVNEMKGRVTSLESEKHNLSLDLDKGREIQQQLNEENLKLKEDLKLAQEKLVKLDSDFAQAQKSIEQLNSRFSLIKSENIALREKNNLIKTELNGASKENESFKARLNSIPALKQAIRELKIQMRKVRKVGVEIKEKIKLNKIVEGNRGFLIKEGKIYYPTKIKIEVMPAPAAIQQ